MAETVQCPQCGARNPAAAQWCGQCFASLGTTDTGFDSEEAALTRSETMEGGPDEPADSSTGRHPAVSATEPRKTVPGTWVCSVCETPNPLAEEECSACGTSIFTAFGAETEEPTVEVEPRAALSRSLIFPGLGHAHVRQGLLGSAIAGLTLMALGFGIAMAASGVGRFGWPLIFLAAAVWVLAAVDAFRIAGERSTDGVLLKPRLITALVGLVVVLVILAALTTQGGSS